MLGEQGAPLGGRVVLPTPTATVQSGTAVRLGKICPACHERYPMDFRVCPRDATELADVSDEEEDLLLGATVGDTFSIVRAIGEGGMARVYEGRHVRLPNRRFAIKVLHPMYAQQPMIVARFQREAEAASGIGHPNVVDVYDVGTTPDARPYLVSEFLEGQDFATLLDERGRIEAPAAVHVVRQVCRALDGRARPRRRASRREAGERLPRRRHGSARREGARLRDLRSSTAAGGATLTQTGMIMGTPGYMPPEQARGGKTDLRADVYGVGAMLYRAVTGRLPFDSDDASEALSMVLTQEPPRPRGDQPSIPEALELVIQRGDGEGADDRYRSMAELDERLAPFDAEAVVGSVSLLPPPTSGSVARPAPKGDARRRHGALAVDRRSRARHPRREARTPDDRTPDARGVRVAARVRGGRGHQRARALSGARWARA